MMRKKNKTGFCQGREPVFFDLQDFVQLEDIDRDTVYLQEYDPKLNVIKFSGFRCFDGMADVQIP